MSLTKIYSSKIYLTSNRKDKIHAAIQNPLNLELVQQVADYLDDESKEELQEAIVDKEAKSAQKSEASEPVDDENVFDTVDSEPSSAPSFSPRHTSGGASSANVFEDFSPDSDESSADDIPDGDISAPVPDTDTPAPDTSSEEPIEQSTGIIGTDDVDSEDSAVLQSGIIKKLLNDEDDASGVARIDITDDETWIYYDDKVNLNDVLDNVISIIKSNGYDMLKFSRLARTDNAVVFDIKE
jgi:hypothetical protein